MAPVQKPTKPSPDFPLFPHATRRWAKKIGGKLYYFGPWGKPEEALAEYCRLEPELRKKPETRKQSNAGKKAEKLMRPRKPRPDFPLFAHRSGQWARKINGEFKYFGVWADPKAAEAEYLARYGDAHPQESTKRDGNGKASRRKRPDKPRKDFPLYAHASGQCAATICGRDYYFGVWADSDAALDRYLNEKDYLEAGISPPDRVEETFTTHEQLSERWLSFKRSRLASSELDQRTYEEYDRTAAILLSYFGATRPINGRLGLKPEEFQGLREQLAKTRKATALGNQITRIRSFYKFGSDAGLYPPICYGQYFSKPSEAARRKEAADRPMRFFTREQILKILDVADPAMKAMALLGANLGFGNEDCSTLPLKILKLDEGWLIYPREKTGIPRLGPLWPVTIQALRDYLAVRFRPAKEYEGLVFITPSGLSWMNGNKRNLISTRFGRLLDKLGIRESGVNFYALRHVFQTVAEGAGDRAAVSAIMGHSPRSDDMASIYRQMWWESRLKAVTNHVHRWLFEKNPEDANAVLWGFIDKYIREGDTKAG